VNRVETVRGPVDVDRLGTTLVHEHVFVLSEEFRQNDAAWDEDAQVAAAIAALRALHARGVDTIVDPTVFGLGRSIPRVQRVAAEVELQIVVATGIYTYDAVPFFFRHRPRVDGRDPMTALFVREIADGIAGTGVKAAFLKCAIDQPGLTRGVERILRAVAAAHRETGAPITVHTHAPSGTGLVAQRVLREEGVDLTRVVIGHSGDSTDLDYLTALMDAGSYAGMDRFGLDALLPFEARVETVAELCRRGYAQRIVLSHDAACHIDWFAPGARELHHPRWHFGHIHDEVLPALRERGVTDAQIATMLIANPRDYFTMPSARRR
jgi:phosphotriesterase-related protein